MPRIALALCVAVGLAGAASLTACSRGQPVNPLVAESSFPTIKSLSPYVIFTHDHLPEGVTVQVYDHTQEGILVLRVATFQHVATGSVLVLGLEVGDIRNLENDSLIHIVRPGPWEITRMVSSRRGDDEVREVNGVFDTIKRSVKRYETDAPIYW